jgi:purine-cytosine permease-like protein
VIGNLLFSWVAIAAKGGYRSGVPTLTFTRSAFGMRGNAVNAFLTWLVLVIFEGVNCVLGTFALISFLQFLGVIGTPTPLVVALCAVSTIAVCAVFAVVGHRLVSTMERYISIALLVALVLLFAFTVGGTNWGVNHGNPAHVNLWAVFLVATSLTASNPISYLFNAPDWFRYMPKDFSGRRMFWNFFATSGLPGVFLGVLGVVLASQTDLSNPIAGVQKIVPTWLYLVFTAVTFVSVIATNVPTLYSSGLNLQALGLPLRRWTATLIDVVVSTAFVLYVLLVNTGFQSVLNNFVALLIVWAAPFGGVWIADAILRRWRWNAVDLHAVKAGALGRYWGRAGWNVSGFIALGAGALTCLLTINAPVFEGPVARLMGGGDLSWLLGFFVSAGVYAALAGRSVRAAADSEVADDARTELEAAIGEEATLSIEH